MENLTEGLTLETLPKAFTHLTNEVSEIKRLLLEKSNEQPTEPDRWFDLNELCQYHEVLLQFVIIFLRQVRKK